MDFRRVTWATALCLGVAGCSDSGQSPAEATTGGAPSMLGSGGSYSSAGGVSSPGAGGAQVTPGAGGAPLGTGGVCSTTTTVPALPTYGDLMVLMDQSIGMGSSDGSGGTIWSATTGALSEFATAPENSGM